MANPRNVQNKLAGERIIYNLDKSIEVAKAISKKGGGECSFDQLAEFLGFKTSRSGMFKARLWEAKIFGLVEGDRNSSKPTDRAKKIFKPAVPQDYQGGKADAFLEVDLYCGIYDHFKGRNLPPEVDLKSILMTTFHIDEKNVKRTIRLFYESAEQAGFFNKSPAHDQLVYPMLNKWLLNK